MSFEQAAAVPEAFLTAHEALLGAAELAPGERVLIHGAAGGVGSAAVQLARELGAFVFATTCSASKLEWLSELGVRSRHRHTQRRLRGRDRGRDPGPRRRRDRGPRRRGLRGAKSEGARHGGRWIVVGLLGGARGNLDFGRLLMQRQTLRGFVMRSRPLTEKAAIVRAFRRDFLGWFAEGRLSPRLDRIYPLAEVRAAHERMEANQNLGKIVLR